MSARDLIQEALHSLEANKGRSLLTILGIVIGIASVIAMTSLIGGIQNSLVNSLQEVVHREVGIVERRNVVIIERKVRSACSNFLAVFHQFLDASDARERRSHGTDTPGTDFLCVGSQTAATLYAGATYVNNNLKIFRGSLHPSFGQLHAFVFGEHVTFA